ncbi:hypothetical protein NX059_010338 [Plenodomus lindquistii]|nr:hypothetical protein NX059_010338 [Plenodomus lindquistii]
MSPVGRCGSVPELELAEAQGSSRHIPALLLALAGRHRYYQLSIFAELPATSSSCAASTPGPTAGYRVGEKTLTVTPRSSCLSVPCQPALFVCPLWHCCRPATTLRYLHPEGYPSLPSPLPPGASATPSPPQGITTSSLSASSLCARRPACQQQILRQSAAVSSAHTSAAPPDASSPRRHRRLILPAGCSNCEL